MNAKDRRTLEMGRRALEFSRAHPDTSPSYTTTLPRLEERLNRAEQFALQQRDGFLKVRAATALKSELRRTLSSVQLNHLADVAKAAATEAPDLARKFVLTRDTSSYLAFRTAARGMAAEALNRKDVLLKHGLAEEVLESLVPLLDQFDAAVEQGTEGHRAHVGASAELQALADEVAQIVRVMDGANRFRFLEDPDRLAAWESASSIVATPRATPPEGELKPAA